jgi:hypothetical protein
MLALQYNSNALFFQQHLWAPAPTARPLPLPLAPCDLSHRRAYSFWEVLDFLLSLQFSVGVMKSHA